MNGTQAIRPSYLYSLLALPFLLGGIGGAFYIVFVGYLHISSTMAQWKLPGETDVELKRDTTYTIFLKQAYGAKTRSNTAMVAPSAVRCEVHLLPNGEMISIERPVKFLRFASDHAFYDSVNQFTVASDGNYLIACQVSHQSVAPGLSAAVGAGMQESLAAIVGEALLVFFAGLAIALLIFFRVIMLRDQSRREIRSLGLKPV